LFRDRGNIVSYDAQHQRQTCTIVDEIPDLTETRFNDVIADPEGRVFAGTMSFGERRNGRLYRLERDGRVELVSDGHATPNGMGFSPDLSTFYFTDSRLRRIYAFDYDRVDAALENQRIVSEVDIEDVERIGRSDGMTVDADGFIWSARIGAGCVLQLEPDGRLAARHDLPTKRVTSLAFGGADLCELFVTSAGGNDKAKHGSYAGALFSLKPGAKGRVEFLSSIG
jgi:D-xylonolactonase